MTPHALIATAILLGIFVLLAGLFGLLYGLGALREANRMVTAAYGCWVLQLAVAMAIVVLTPLGVGWKILIVASCLAYLAIPRITWRYLQQLHSLNEGGQPTIP
ncbi:MAG: hypothetical protein ACREQI_04180 [Candidatus Binataceae bacterium]